jgi:hypothetical protein
MPRLRKLPIALSFDTTLTFECPSGLDFRLARSVSPQLVTGSLGAIVFLSTRSVTARTLRTSFLGAAVLDLRNFDPLIS